MATKGRVEQKIRELIRKGKYQEAISEYHRLLETHLDDPELLNNMGDTYRVAGLIEDAIISYEQAMLAYEKESLYNNAIAIGNKILRIEPDRVEIYNQLGKLYGELGLPLVAMTSLIEYANRKRM